MENSLDEMGGFDLPTGTKCPENASWVDHIFRVRLEHLVKLFWTLSMRHNKKGHGRNERFIQLI